MPRRRRPLSITGSAVLAAVAALALGPAPGRAQTLLADTSQDLLQPSLDGNPNNPPRFRRQAQAGTSDQTPAPGAFMAPSRIGATPVYGSPNGFGAGDTGFDSTNGKRRGQPSRTQSQSDGLTSAPETTFDPVQASPAIAPPKPIAPPPLPVVYPAKAAARPGAVLPPPPTALPISNPPPEVHPVSAAGRPGAVVPPPIDTGASASTPPPGTPPPNTLPLGTPSRALPLAGGDPYAALGIRAGSLLFLPAIEFSAVHDNNPQHVPGGAPSTYFIVAPELHVRSDWPTNSFTADIVSSYTDYTQTFTPSLNRPYLNSKMDGTLDVTRSTQVLLENRVIVTTDNPGSPNLTAGLAKLPIDTTVGGTLGVTQQFNRVDVSLRGAIDRSVYQPSTLTDGEISGNGDRNFDQYAGILRLGYEMNPGLKPFVEVSEDTRVHDDEFDREGLRRDSNGTSGKVGATVDLFGSLSGEIAVGYMERIYQDPSLPMIAGPTADGSLIWQATPLTTAKLTASSAIAESILPGVSGAFSRDFNIQIDHALRRWLIGTVKVGYGRDIYAGSPRDDNRYFASIGITYMLNRNMQVKSELRQDWLTSSVSGVAYTATSALLGLRLQE